MLAEDVDIRNGSGKENNGAGGGNTEFDKAEGLRCSGIHYSVAFHNAHREQQKGTSLLMGSFDFEQKFLRLDAWGFWES